MVVVRRIMTFIDTDHCSTMELINVHVQYLSKRVKVPTITVRSWFASGAFKVCSWCAQGALVVRLRFTRGTLEFWLCGAVRCGLVQSVFVFLMRYSPPIVGYMRMCDLSFRARDYFSHHLLHLSFRRLPNTFGLR